MDNNEIVVVDCRFDLADTSQGEKAYKESHLPNAVYAHLDKHLSGPVQKGVTGRQPLPDAETLSALFSTWGISKDKLVVVYDNVTGPFAARLWWMLVWLGHTNTRVLDGGWKKWTSEGRETTTVVPQAKPVNFKSDINASMLADVTDVEDRVANKNGILVDARTADRFAGENETMDPKAGHIPGAINIPFVSNLTDTGEFKTAEALANQYQQACLNKPGEDVLIYCGSGVSATHNALAMIHAGMDGMRIYVDSWSHWINDDDHGIATGIND